MNMVQAPDDIVDRDLPEAFKLLREMHENVDQVTQLVDNMLARVKRGEMSTDKGLSFLEVKYHMLLSYLINLTYVVLRKISGRKIEDDPSIDRLVEIRTVLEKMRPIDQKLKYQIDKLVKTAVTGTVNENDPLNFRANPANLISNVDESEESDSGSDDDEKNKAKQTTKEKKGVYVPPKLAAVHYDGDESKVDFQRRMKERAQKRALSMSLMQELKDEYLDTPTEVTQASSQEAVLTKHDKEREEYEETYFTRLTVTKQERHQRRKILTLGRLGDQITQFNDGPGPSNAGSNKKRKMEKGKGKKGFKKRRFH